MAVDLADKLQLTARALGCVTQKELCARFFELNPNTQFTLQNSYKWMKGRSQPRSGAVYRDWALLLDIDQSPQFLSECPLDVFSSLVSARYDLDLPGSPAGDAPVSGQSVMLQGEYACYSLAWSKAARGQLIRSSLTMSLNASGELRACYEERVAGGELRFTGRTRPLPRSLSLIVEDAERGHSLYLCFPAPMPPGTILTGLLAGTVYHDFEMRPTAARMLCVRSKLAPGAIERGNRYIDPDVATLNADLEALGYDLSADREIGALCRDFLTPAADGDRLEVPLSESEALAMAFARLQMP